MIHCRCWKLYEGGFAVPPTSAHSPADWKDGFLFLGNHLALDFLNTRPVQDGRPRELLPDFDALLRWFAAAALLTPTDTARFRQRWRDSPPARQTLETAHTLRERLREEVVAWERGAALHRSFLDELNRLMAELPMRARLRAAGPVVSEEAWFPADSPRDLLAPLARAAADLFAAANRSRVRQCANCVLHFHDTSKTGTRRWCSMSLCGNRLKVAAYAARRRKL